MSLRPTEIVEFSGVIGSMARIAVGNMCAVTAVACGGKASEARLGPKAARVPIWGQYQRSMPVLHAIKSRSDK